MDLVGACSAFVSVSERGSFTVGAAAARMSQSVASRRVAALEERLGEKLFERTARRAVLTAFGREMLPVARQLVQAAEVLLHEAESARRRPWRLAVPAVCPTADRARLVAEARGYGVTLDLCPEGPARRQELLHAHQVRAGVVAVPPDGARWTVPLGLAAADDSGPRRVHLETLRVGRAVTGPARRVWVQPEDDVPHIRDPLTRLRDAVGLRPTQLVTATDLTTAAAEVLTSHDLLLCSPAQATELALHWRPLGGITLARGYALAAAEGTGRHMEERLGDALARCLGADHVKDAGRAGRAGRATHTGVTGPTGAETDETDETGRAGKSGGPSGTPTMPRTHRPDGTAL